MGCVAHDAKVGELLARTVHERSTGALGSESNFSSKGASGYSESILGDVILKLSVMLTEVCELLGGFQYFQSKIQETWRQDFGVEPPPTDWVWDLECNETEQLRLLSGTQPRTFNCPHNYGYVFGTALLSGCGSVYQRSCLVCVSRSSALCPWLLKGLLQVLDNTRLHD